MAFLSEYRVIDLTDERGLMAGHILAKLGADVIQVEPIGGSSARRAPPLAPDGTSFFWSAYAAGKRSVMLDYRSKPGREALLELVRQADFLFESADPGDLDAMGLSRAVLQGANPRLIHVSITAFGSTGPKASWAADDLTLWAAGGPLNATKDNDGKPLGFSVPQSWLHACADAAGGALVAHFARLRSGRGQHVDISAQASVSQATLGVLLAEALGHKDYDFHPKPAPSRKKVLDLSGSGSRTRKSKWQVKDGLVEMHLGIGKAAGRVANAIYGWVREAGGLPPHLHDWDWCTVPERIAAGEIDEDDVDAAREVMVPFLAQFDRKSLMAEATRRKVPIAPINDVADLVTSDHMAERGAFARVDEHGRERLLPWQIARGPGDMMAEPRGAPALGEHNREVLGGVLGLSDDRITELSERSLAVSAYAGAEPPPFQGLFVLDLAWVVAGPAITRVLADFGADIIRVESRTRVCTSRFVGPFPGGQFSLEHSACFDECNTGKQSLSLNLNSPAGREIALELARKADVVIESFSPGQIARWGLDYERLSQDNPGLVMLSTSLMGQTGPYSGFAGYGNAGAAVGGFQTLVGYPGEKPIGPFGPYTDFIGPRFGLIVLLAALDNRRRTGRGCYLDVSQVETGLQMLAPQVADYAATGHLPKANGNRSDHRAPQAVFPCVGEDQWVAIVARDDVEWRKLAQFVGGDALSPDFTTLADRKQHEDRLEALLASWTRDRTTGEVEERLQAAGIPVHRATSSEDAVADPQWLHQGHFIRLERSDRTPSVVEASGLMLSSTPARTVKVAPFLGQDTMSILRDRLGYDEDRIESLRQAGALQ